MLEVRRQRELLAEVLERLVGRESGAERRDLEQDAAGLAEVDRLEPEPVDDRRRMHAVGLDAAAPLGVLLVRRCPGNMVDGACSRDGAAFGRDVVAVERAARLGPNLPLVTGFVRREAQRLLEEAATRVGIACVRSNAVEPL